MVAPLLLLPEGGDVIKGLQDLVHNLNASRDARGKGEVWRLVSGMDTDEGSVTGGERDTQDSSTDGGSVTGEGTRDQAPNKGKNRGIVLCRTKTNQAEVNACSPLLRDGNSLGAPPLTATQNVRAPRP